MEGPAALLRARTESSSCSRTSRTTIDIPDSVVWPMTPTWRARQWGQRIAVVDCRPLSHGPAAARDRVHDFRTSPGHHLRLPCRHAPALRPQPAVAVRGTVHLGGDRPATAAADPAPARPRGRAGGGGAWG